MAMEDLRELEADGVDVGPLDAILLNEAGCEVELGNLRSGCPVRRIVRIGDRFFSEMTISQFHEFQTALEILHLSEFSKRATELAAIVALRLWFSETGKERVASGESLDDALGLLVEIGKNTTSESLLDALRWLGRCEGESQEESREESGEEIPEEPRDVFLSMSVDGGSLLGIPPSEARRMTTSQLMWAIDRKNRAEGRETGIDNAAFVKYTRTLERIRNGENRN